MVKRSIAHLVLAVLLISFCVSASSSQGRKEHSGLFPITQDGKIGFIDRTGKVIIPPQFGIEFLPKNDPFAEFAPGALVDPFAEELLTIALRPGKWGCIDRTGKFVITPQYQDVGVFSEGLVAVKVDGKWGYVDRTGRFVIPPQFPDHGIRVGSFHMRAINYFSEGLALTTLEDGIGYIDRTGKVVIPPERGGRSWRTPFFNGLAIFREGQARGFMDKKGHTVIAPRPEFEFAKPFSDGLAAVGYNTPKSTKWGFINLTGRLVIEQKFDEVFPFTEGLAAVKVEGKWGYINRRGRFVIQPRFSQAFPFSEGLASVYVGELPNRQAGYIDKTGRFVIKPRFEIARPFFGALAEVIIGQGQGNAYIDKSGRYVWKSQ